jgi:hypothetical protein
MVLLLVAMCYLRSCGHGACTAPNKHAALQAPVEGLCKDCLVAFFDIGVVISMHEGCVLVATPRTLLFIH